MSNVLDTQTRAQGLEPTPKDLDAAVAFVRVRSRIHRGVLLGPMIADQLDLAVLNAATTMYPQMAAGLARAPKAMQLPRDPYQGLSLDTRVELAKAGTLIL